MKKVFLQKGRDFSVKKGHRWIFSGAILKKDEGIGDGDCVEVCEENGKSICWGYINTRTSIAIRVVGYDCKNPKEEFRLNIENACDLRKNLFETNHTNAYRIINAEADGIPGIVFDRYGKIGVIESSTAGADFWVEEISQQVMHSFGLVGVYEKSNNASRKQEGILPKQGWVLGNWDQMEGEVLENDMRFLIDLHGQKTGFFLDQREMRELVQRISFGKNVANCFGYSGGFSVAAWRGGAKRVDTIDISEEALSLAQKNKDLNDFSHKEGDFICEDVFDFIEKKDLSLYDIVILDPPAFVKKKQDIGKALKGYHALNAQTMKKVKKGAFLLTCSCSHYVGEEDFVKMLTLSAKDAKRNMRVLSKHRLAPDHPISFSHPEGEYLKSFLLEIY